MSRKIKALGIACVAVFALTAISASSATAASAFTVGTGGTKIDGTQATTQKLALGAGGTIVKCTTSTLKATVSAGTVTELTAIPLFGGCALAGVTATIETHSCTFTITNTATAFTANVDLTNCPSTAGIVINTAFCTVTMSNQGPLSSVTLSNNGGSPADVTATLLVFNIAYTGSIGCPANVAGSHSDATLGGSYLLVATNSSGSRVNLLAD